MRRRTLFVALSLALASSACGASHRDLELELFPVADGAIAPPALQRLTAIHEAAHTVAAELYFGEGFVQEVHIDVKCCGPGLHGHVGHTIPSRGVPLENDRDHQVVMAMFLIGMTAERVLAGVEGTDDVHDRRQATRIARLSLGLSEEGELTPGEAASVRHALDLAQVRAQAVLRVNRDVILRLAELLLAQPEVAHRRTVDARMLRSFFAANPLRDPSAERP